MIDPSNVENLGPGSYARRSLHPRRPRPPGKRKHCKRGRGQSGGLNSERLRVRGEATTASERTFAHAGRIVTYNGEPYRFAQSEAGAARLASKLNGAI